MKLKRSLLFVAALLCSNLALAMPITGLISWEGQFSRTGDAFSFSNVEVGQATHDFATAGFSHNDPLSVAGFDIGSFTPVVLWAQNGITFTLNSINVLLDMPMLTALTGNAIVSGAGFEPTSYSLYFSTSMRNFSASAVPEPGMGLLMLSGVAGLLVMRRRQVSARTL